MPCFYGGSKTFINILRREYSFIKSNLQIHRSQDLTFSIKLKIYYA